MTYSVAVSYYDDEKLEVVLFPNFKEFFETLSYKIKRSRQYNLYTFKPIINLIAQNNNRYDNHFLRKDFLYFFPKTQVYNAYLKSALTNDDTIQKQEINQNKQKYKTLSIIEKRVKTSINIELEIYYYGIYFRTVDNYVKTGLSIDSLGKKLLNLGKITKEELKTDFDYLEFNKEENMTESQARNYANEIFTKKLTDKHFTYIKNDVIILGKSHHYYNLLFPKFDYKKITLTSNILESYLVNEETRYQLLKRVKNGKKVEQLKYTDYQFNNTNLYDYIKSFYNGGLNFYNQKYLGKLLNEEMFTIDINSSYPYVMYKNKIPYNIKNYSSKPCELYFDLENENEFTIFKINYHEMNVLLNRIDSILIQQLIVKYFKYDKEEISINTNVLRLINNFSSFSEVRTLKVNSFITFKCKNFSARNKIAEYYFIKTQGKLENKIVMNTPFDYEILNEKNMEIFNEEEIYSSKVKMNGLYGIPALRAYFNLFRVNENDEIYNYRNGFKNSERNIIFSVFVTSQALYNLLEPLHVLTGNEIDNNLVYGDTDSLYLKKKVLNKLDKNLFDDISLGKWSIDDDEISQFSVLNHKKYCYYSNKIKDGEKKGIVVKCGGIPLDSFNLDYNNLEEFIKNEFHVGKKVKNKRNIYTKEKQIAIYTGITKIEKGFNYPYVYSPLLDEIKEEIFEDIRKNRGTDNELVFYGTPFGTFSDMEIDNFKHEFKTKDTIDTLILKEKGIEAWLENEK